jgi:hypothetical protein
MTDVDRGSLPVASIFSGSRWSAVSIWLGVSAVTAAVAGIGGLIISTNSASGSDLLMRALLAALGLAFVLGASGFASAIVALIRREGWTAVVGLGLGLAGMLLAVAAPAAVIYATYLIRG